MATEAEMKAKLILELQDEMSKALNSMSNKAQKQADKTQSKWKKALNGMQDSYIKSMKNMRLGQQKFGQGLKDMGKAALMATPFVLMAKQAAEFDEKMRESATLVNTPVEKFRATFDKIIEKTQVTFGKKAQDVIGTFYDGISAGVKATKPDIETFLNTTGKLATAGKVDLKIAGDAITSIVNAYGEGSEGMKKASDILFATVREGKTTIGELAGSVGQIAPVAAALGVSFEEVGAAMAAITSGGLSTAEAATQVKAGLSSMIKFTDGAKKQLKKLNIEVDASTIAKNGMFETIVMIDKAIRKNIKSVGAQKEAFASIFPNIRALQFGMAATGKQNDKFRQSLDVTKNSLGFTDEAFKKMQGDMFKYRQLQQKAEVATRKLGESSLKIFTKIADRLTPLLDKFNDFIDKNEGAIDGFMRLAAAIIGLKVGVGIFNMLHGSILMLSNPIGLAIVGIAGIGYAMNALSDETTEAGRAFSTTFASVEGFFAGVANMGLFLLDIIRQLANTFTLGLFEKFGKMTGFTEKWDKLNATALAWQERIGKEEKVVEKGGGSFLEQFLGFNTKMKEAVTTNNQQANVGGDKIEINAPITIQGNVTDPKQTQQAINNGLLKTIEQAQMRKKKKQQLAKVF